MNKELNPWSVMKIIHKNKIKEFNFLLKNDLIVHIESDFYYSVKKIEEKYYKLKYEEICKELGLNENIEGEIQRFIRNLNEYNELKDCAEALIGKLAELKNVSIKEMRDQIGTPE